MRRITGSAFQLGLSCLVLLSVGAVASASEAESGSDSNGLHAVGPQPADPGVTETRDAVATETVDYSGTVKQRDEDTGWRWVPRALLWVPRMVFRYVIAWPVDKAVDLISEDKHAGRWKVFPLAFYRMGFQYLLGLRVEHFLDSRGHNLVSAEGAYGGMDFQHYRAELRSQPSRSTGFGAVLWLHQQGDASFWGEGNQRDNDERTRFFREDVEASAQLQHDWTRSNRFVTTLSTGYYRTRTTDTDDLRNEEVTLTDRFDPAEAPGFGESQNFLHAAVGATLDLRPDPRGRTTGTMLDGHIEGYWSIDGDDFSTLLYGGSWLGVVEVFRQRTIAARLVLEGAEPLGGDVPFYLLPVLGQGTLVRGYASGRLRDQVLTVANIEYRWPVAEQGDAFLFFDTGRVFPDLGSIDLNDWHWGTGIGVKLRSRRGGIVSAQFAYSLDGIELSFLAGKDLF